MKKILILIGILAAALLAVFIFNRNLNQSGKIGASDFAIEKPKEIDKIYMTANNSKGKYLILSKNEAGNWFVENGTEKCEADSNVINTLLYTIMSKLEVKNPIADAAVPNISKELNLSGTKTEFYKNGKLYKTMWIGSPTGSFKGTYAFMEQHDRPCIVAVPKIDMFISPYFIVNIEEWRSPILLHCPYESIAELNMTWPATPEGSFRITKNGNDLSLFNAAGSKTNITGNSVRSYLDRFVSISRATGEPAQINRNIIQRDSVLNGSKYCIISIKDTKGKLQKITLYPKAIGGETYSLNDPSKPGQLKTFETDSYWITAGESKTLYEIQDIVVKNRLWKIGDFN